MIGLDTNVLVRYLAQDDTKQSPLVNRLLEKLNAESPGFISLVTVIELVWVLQSCYGATRPTLADTLDRLLRTKDIHVQKADVVWQALRQFRDGSADFADCLIERSAADAGCVCTYTFDRDASTSCGMRLIA